MVFDAEAHRDHEQVTFISDEASGLQAIVAVQDTTLGPALGGTRMLDYDSVDDALRDVLRLSYAMTYKAAAADLELGGGKAVILGDPKMKSEDMLRAYGRAIDDQAGRYITSVDVNTSVSDMDIIAEETEHVTGTSEGLGDPSPITAHGVLYGIKACVEHVYGDDSLSDIHVAVQGVGKVGSHLVKGLVDHGADVTIADPNEDTVLKHKAKYGVESVRAADIYDVSCEVFAPCAFGGALNDKTIPRLSCDIVAGGANNILEDETRHSQQLHDRGVLYAPDYVLNAGGLITVGKEYLGGSRENAFEEAEQIGDRVLDLIDRAEETDSTVLEATREYVEERLAEAAQPVEATTE